MLPKKKVLMVCFGNTCRSPIAEAVFRKYVEDHNMQDDWEVDSAALYGYHEGNDINPKSRLTLEKHGITNYQHLSRTLRKEDFDYFDWILGMDYYNVEHLIQIQPQNSSATIELLGQYSLEEEKIIEDPYINQDIQKFEKCYQQCTRFISIFFENHK